MRHNRKWTGTTRCVVNSLLLSYNIHQRKSLFASSSPWLRRGVAESRPNTLTLWEEIIQRRAFPVSLLRPIYSILATRRFSLVDNAI
ncbi:hypothetical protein SK128_004603 [Halocaridina rubra]|uniref:Uncharacterized protein n=1 Tax=Halocaridina rubra TaxID=373956 RepID=A0AAN9AF73_HALRR